MTSPKKRLRTNGNGKGSNPNSQANLAIGRAKLAEMRTKGILPNPAGYSLTADIKHQLNQEAEFISPTARPKDKLWREQISRAILVGAAKGEVPMVKEVWDRVDGKVPGDTPPVTNVNVVFMIGRGYQDADKNRG